MQKKNVEFNICCRFIYMEQLMHLSMSSWREGGGVARRGIGQDFDIFQKIAVKFLPPGKNVRSNITKFPTPRNDLWSRARTKIQILLPPEQQENSNALPPGQNDRSKSRPMPRLPPRRLDIDRWITRWRTIQAGQQGYLSTTKESTTWIGEPFWTCWKLPFKNY